MSLVDEALDEAAEAMRAPGIGRRVNNYLIANRRIADSALYNHPGCRVEDCLEAARLAVEWLIAEGADQLPRMYVNDELSLKQFEALVTLMEADRCGVS